MEIYTPEILIPKLENIKVHQKCNNHKWLQIIEIIHPFQTKENKMIVEMRVNIAAMYNCKFVVCGCVFLTQFFFCQIRNQVSHDLVLKLRSHPQSRLVAFYPQVTGMDVYIFNATECLFFAPVCSQNNRLWIKMVKMISAGKPSDVIIFTKGMVCLKTKLKNINTQQTWLVCPFLR